MKKLLLLFTALLISLTSFGQLPFENEIYSNGQIVTNYFKYGTQNEDYLKLYVPVTPNLKPLLVIVPGSGFLYDNDYGVVNTFADEALSFAKRGYAVIVVNYHRSTNPCGEFRATAAEAAADVQAAIQYTLHNGYVFNINPGFIFIYGQSAGGIAATSTVWLSESRFSNKFGISKNKNCLNPNIISYTVKGMALESSGMLDQDVFTQSDINISTPLTLYHGLGDLTVPFQEGNSNLCPSPLPQVYVYGSNSIVAGIVNSAPSNPRRYICCKQYTFLTTNHNVRSAPANYTNVTNYLLGTTASYFAGIISATGCVQTNTVVPVRVGNEESGTEELMTQEEIIFTNDQLRFQLSTSATSTFRLYDMSGVLTREMQVNNESSVALHDLAAGVYIAVVETEHGIIKKKISIQR